MERHRAIRVVSSERCGSSRPVLIETDGGRCFAKLLGAGQGPAALVAEVIVAVLADALDLLVPDRSLVFLDDRLECDDRDPELIDLLHASRGWNLGFRELEGARVLRAGDLEDIDSETASKVVGLDGLVMNLDRTLRNPNILRSGGEMWLIDHGASLGFQHRWSTVTEESPRRVGCDVNHVLFSRATEVGAWDARLAATLDRSVIRKAVEAVPDSFLSPLVPWPATPSALARRREAYTAFLWKRLKLPRPFVPANPDCIAG